MVLVYFSFYCSVGRKGQNEDISPVVHSLASHSMLGFERHISIETEITCKR
jgi:hypothetical protein